MCIFIEKKSEKRRGLLGPHFIEVHCQARALKVLPSDLLHCEVIK